MASQGPRNPGTASQTADIFGGASNWWQGNGSPADAQLLAAVQATGGSSVISVGQGLTGKLRLSNFGFASVIPAGSTIDGIVANYRRQDSASGPGTETTVRLMKGGVEVGDNKASGTWPSSWAIQTRGGSTDLWGTTWTTSDLDSGFGLSIEVDSSSSWMEIDHATITVYYTEASSGPALPVFIHHYRQQGFM